MEREYDSNVVSPMPISSIYEIWPSPFPAVYIKTQIEKDPSLIPVILLTGFSGSGKDTVLSPFLDSNEATHVRTATSRLQGVGEPDSAYIWMRPKREDESEEDFLQSLIEEHDLIESNCHYGTAYGLPRSSLEKKASGIRVIRTDIHGVRTLLSVLPPNGYQPISVAVMPDNWDQVLDSLRERKRDNEKEIQNRLKEDIATIELYREYIHMFLHNTRERIDGDKSGLDIAIEGLRYILNKYK